MKTKTSFHIGESTIPWTSYGWNFMTGCNHKCPYCYARALLKRRGGIWAEYEVKYLTGMDHCNLHGPTTQNAADFIDRVKNFSPTLMSNRIDRNIIYPKEASSIFCTALSDPVFWPQTFSQAATMEKLYKPPHIYLFLSKEPPYADWAPKDNVVCGYTADTRQALYAMADSAMAAKEKGHKKHFLSLEPMLEDMAPLAPLVHFDWVITGPLNGPMQNEAIMRPEWFEAVRIWCQMLGIPIFEKPEVSRIVDRSLVQQYPAWHPQGIL